MTAQPAGASTATGIAACAPGTYKGTYDIGLLGMGPITFELVPGMAASTGKCEEFCPDLVLNSNGGEFYAAWVGFVGRAGLSGGLDCRTGEFRAEMVDGKFGLNFDPNANPDATLDAGMMTGRFVGHFDTASAKVTGDIQCNAGAGIDIAGTFEVMRGP